MNKRVKSIKALRKLCPGDFFIQLNQGLISRKTIRWVKESDKPGHEHEAYFIVKNCADNTTQYLTDDEMDDDTKTNIGRAIGLGAFYKITETSKINPRDEIMVSNKPTGSIFH